VTILSSPAFVRAAFTVRHRIEVTRRSIHGARAERAASTAGSTPAQEAEVAKPRVAVVYVYPVVGDSEHDISARRFVATYREFPPTESHSLHVVFNGSAPAAENVAVFDGLQVQFHEHDNVGWDIGAFQMAARVISCDLIVCLGANSHFTRAGWLGRMVAAACMHGDALYGASASYERDPHIRTTAFWCDPMILRAYPIRVRTQEERYAFEAGALSLTRLTEHVGLQCWLVTWSGEYLKGDWRIPADIFRRGDQSNALVRDRYFDLFDAMDDETRSLHASMADGPQPQRV